MSGNRLFCFGLGFSGLACARRLLQAGWHVGGTCRSAEKAEQLRAEGIDAHVFTGEAAMAGATAALEQTTCLLVAIAPGEHGDPVLIHHGDDIAALAGQSGTLERIVYLSTTAVYGDHGGGWIDESTAINPVSPRAIRRVDAEAGWERLAANSDLALDILRLSGIYGFGRSPIDNVAQGRARRIVKPGHVFNRIHVDDIATTLEHLARAGLPGTIYNLADDEPAPPQDVIAFAAGLIGVEPPRAVAFDQAEMTPMARSFYGESKRVMNSKIKQQLGVQLAYGTYREGLTAIAARLDDKKERSGN